MKTLRTHGFNQRPRFEQVVGYLERNEPLPLDQPDRKATSFVTSHFYLDDFVQSSEDPNPWPLQHTPLHPEDGFRTPAEATDEDVRLARRYQGYGGTRFVEDDLAGDPEAGALASNGQGPPSITDRLRSTADGAQAAADLIGAGAAGLAAAQAFRSQLPQDAAEYVRLDVLPRPGQAQPPPQIIGQPSDVERFLDEAGQRAHVVQVPLPLLRLPALAQPVVEGPRLLQFAVALQQQRLQVIAGVRPAEPPEHPRLVAGLYGHHAFTLVRLRLWSAGHKRTASPACAGRAAALL